MNDKISVSELRTQIIESSISPADLRIVMDIINNIQSKITT